MEENYDIKSARRAFSRCGLAMLMILVIGSVIQVVAVLLPARIWGPEHWILSTSWGLWLSTFVPLYLIAVPIGLLSFRGIPKCPPQDNRMRFTDFIILLLIGFCLMQAGNIVGTVMSVILSGGTAENALVDFAMDNNPLKILIVVILAPIIEEYICRKKIIDCVGVYGEKTAVIFSGLIFGLFHGNLYQFFYAFLLGMLFAYIYIRTGRLRYSIYMHMIVNFLGSVVAPFIISMMDMELLEKFTMMESLEILAALGKVLPGLMLYLLYSEAITGAAVGGLALLLIRWRETVWMKAPLELPGNVRKKTAYFNVGVILYMIGCLALMVLALM